MLLNLTIATFFVMVAQPFRARFAAMICGNFEPVAIHAFHRLHVDVATSYVAQGLASLDCFHDTAGGV